MRGIILAGGTGSRLGAVTKVVNKHLLLVGGKPMIQWPIDVLRHNGVYDITIVSTPRGVGQLAELLGGGYNYRVQDEPGGIAQAIGCAGRYQSEDSSIAVILGDNVFFPSPILCHLTPDCSAACVFLKEVSADRIKEFGVPRFDGPKIIHIEEKPEFPDCNVAVTGLYIFSPDVFDRILTIGHSARGESEVTDLLNMYATENSLAYRVVLGGCWGDAGTIAGMRDIEEQLNKTLRQYEENPGWPK